ncbi:MAG: shikimate kinase [Patescibacteria group bacterium UBA2103]
MNNLFLIGPASVGKTTAGTSLAKRLDKNFIDIDEEFCTQIAPISEYLKEYGYESYCEANSELALKLTKENPKDIIFATPSGFLVHEKSPHLVQKHLKLLKEYGVSILLLPPESFADQIAARQIKRWNLDFEKEKQKFLDRHAKYKQYGDIQIDPSKDKETIVEEIIQKLT